MSGILQFAFGVVIVACLLQTNEYQREQTQLLREMAATLEDLSKAMKEPRP